MVFDVDVVDALEGVTEAELGVKARIEYFFDLLIKLICFCLVVKSL